jgi:hypothetical protein
MNSLTNHSMGPVLAGSPPSVALVPAGPSDSARTCRGEFSNRFPNRAAFLATLCLLSSSASLARADAIVRHDGRRIDDVRITEASWDGVRYEQNGQAQRLGGDEVLAIERDSLVLRAARQALESGDFAAAFREFKTVRDSSSGWEKAEAGYFMGRSLLHAGKKEASAAFKEYLDAFGDSKDWWLPAAVEGRAEAELVAGRGETANKLFGDLEKYGKNWVLRARIGQGRALFAAGKHTEARKAFSDVAGSRTAPASMRRDALAGRAEVQIHQEQYAAAIKDLEDSFFKSARPEDAVFDVARARATLLIGLAHKGQGGTENLQRAEIWLLKVTGLYGAFPSVVQEAAGHLADVYEKLGNQERARQWREKAPKKG